MEKDKVYFLGEEYEFPHELYEYVIYCRQFQNDREQLLTTMFNRMQNHVYSFPDAELECMLRDACRNTIRYLAKAGIYDITEEDLISDNFAYKQFQELQANAAQQLSVLAKQSASEYNAGFDQAVRNAASQITGSGYSLISNSLLAHMAFGAMESSKIQAQEEKAKRSLQESLESLQKQTYFNKQQREWGYVIGKVYPEYMRLIEEFFLQLINRYLSILEQNEIYSYSTINCFSMTRSSELFQNLKLVEDIDGKKNVLIQSFKSCPYNVDIYQYLINMDMLDENTEKTLEFYEQKEALIDSVKKYLSTVLYADNTLEKIKIAQSNIRWLGYLQNISAEQVEEQCFSIRRNSIKSELEKLCYLCRPVWTFDDVENELKDKKCDNIHEYVEKIVENSGVINYQNICGDAFIRDILKKLEMKSEDIDSFKTEVETKLNQKYQEFINEKKERQDAEEKERKLRNKILTVGGIILAIVALVLGGGKIVIKQQHQRKIDNLVAEVNGTKFILDTHKFSNSQWIISVEVTVATEIGRDYDYNTLMHDSREMYKWDEDLMIDVIVKNDFDSLKQKEKEDLIWSIKREAYEIGKDQLAEKFPEYCDYFELNENNHKEMEEYYGKWMFSNNRDYINVTTESGIDEEIEY